MVNCRASKVVEGDVVSAVGKGPQAFNTPDPQRTRAIVGQALGYVNIRVYPITLHICWKSADCQQLGLAVTKSTKMSNRLFFARVKPGEKYEGLNEIV